MLDEHLDDTIYQIELKKNQMKLVLQIRRGKKG